MQALTEAGRKAVAQIASRHGVSSDAAGELLLAIAAGGGRQAQFNHPELGGMGQWSQGGMIMIGDMFNHGLKARVAALCGDLAEALPGAVSDADARSDRWLGELGVPASTGSQNDLHYAIFPQSRRLAVERDGQITVYDTAEHRIGGISQQQGSDQTLRFTDQAGVVGLSDLRIVEPATADAPDTPSHDPAVPLSGKSVPLAVQSSGATGQHPDDEVFSRLERLAELRSRDIITAEEFAAKKAELLARL